LITEFREGSQEVITVTRKFGGGKARNILKENCSWFDSLDERKSRWEHIPVIIGT
jgi:hypothetical protein